jgi:hypothetical protein
VIIGGGKDGLPIILGNVDNPAGSGAKANATEGDTAPNEVAPNEKASTTSPGQTNPLPKPAGSAGAPPATDKNNAAAVSPAPPNVTQAQTPTAPGSYLPLDLSQIKNYVPQLPEWLRSAPPGTGSGTGAPKQ